MRRTVLRSNPEYWDYSLPKQLEAYRNLQLPVSFCYFTLKNGLHVMYPGNNGVQVGYDGRTRPWYKAAEGKGATPVWVIPYQTVWKDTSKVVSCAMEIIGAREKVHGIAAVDIPIDVLAAVLSRNSARAVWTTERMLISEEGKIILSCTGNGKAFAMKELVNGAEFDFKIFSKMKHRRYGRIARQENGKEILWVYSFIPTAHWIYVEKIDMEQLLAFNSTIH